ncbi:MAG: Inorganic triphosphatase [Desulfovibrio sp.]
MTEIERKFLVKDDSWRGEVTETKPLRQGYIATEAAASVRVRIDGNEARLTIKGKKTRGAGPEFEYAIPMEDAEALLETCAKKPFIEKNRHIVRRDGLVWEVDEFFGENAGLIVAEVELTSPDQEIPLPEWIGREVTADSRYANARLVQTPYAAWPENLKK